MEEREPQPTSEPTTTNSLPPIHSTAANIEVSDWIAGIAAVTAVISLIISVLGYRVAQEQTALSRDQLEQSRSLWWLCSVDEDLVLTLSPSSKDAIFESVLIVFPKSIFAGREEWVFRPKNLQLSLQDIHKRLMIIRASDLTFDKATGRYNVHAAPDLLPFVVESSYMVGGSMHYDRTMFFIRIRTKFSLGPPSNNVKLEKLVLSDAYLYGKLGDAADDTDETLSKYWEPSREVIAQVKPLGGRVTMEGPFFPRKPNSPRPPRGGREDQ